MYVNVCVYIYSIYIYKVRICEHMCIGVCTYIYIYYTHILISFFRKYW
jgi:hypothetical protein